MGRPIGSKNKAPYPSTSHFNASKYGHADRYALQHFKGMHNRARDGKVASIEWPRTAEGYAAFCEEIGSIPAHIRKPSVGRKDHSKGYESGNVVWEEYSWNSVKRRGTRYENHTC